MGHRILKSKKFRPDFAYSDYVKAVALNFGVKKYNSELEIKPHRKEPKSRTENVPTEKVREKVEYGNMT